MHVRDLVCTRLRFRRRIRHGLAAAVVAGLAATPVLAQDRCFSPELNAVSTGFQQRAGQAAAAWKAGKPIERYRPPAPRVAQPLPPPPPPPIATAPASTPAPVRTTTVRSGPTAGEVFGTLLGVAGAAAAIYNAGNAGSTGSGTSHCPPGGNVCW